MSHNSSSSPRCSVGAAQALAAVLLLLPSSGLGSTLRVPDDYLTIQAAVGAAANGDTVLVSPGVYSENVVVSAKGIVLASEFHTTGDSSRIDSTIIDGGGTGAAITTLDTPDGMRVTGFTIRNAADGILARNGRIDVDHNRITDTGDGIDYESSDGQTIAGSCHDNVFEFNSDDGIDLDDSSEINIERNAIRDNGDDGIEIRIEPYTGPTLEILIRNNVISGNGEDGIQLIWYDVPTDRHFRIERNLIEGNADAGIGMMDNQDTNEDFRAASIPEPIDLVFNTIVNNSHGVSGGDNVAAINNIIADSTVLGTKEIDGGSIVSHQLYWDNAADDAGSSVDVSSMIAADPLFDAAFELMPGSPAIDSGAASFEWRGETILSLQPTDYNGSAPDRGYAESSAECTDHVDCDDGAFCNGAESCVAGACEPGTNPCPDMCDEAGDVCVGCGDGICASGEDCSTCPADCISGSVEASCGNGLCETAHGEDCVSCPDDCNGRQNRKLSQRFCCGDGGQNPVDCEAPMCTSSGFRCTPDPQLPVSYCCGDGTCNGYEDPCSCAVDCGAHPTDEAGLCTDGADNDCDAAVDCDDADCSGHAACSGSRGDACMMDNQCASGICKPNGKCR